MKERKKHKNDEDKREDQVVSSGPCGPLTGGWVGVTQRGGQKQCPGNLKQRQRWHGKLW